MPLLISPPPSPPLEPVTTISEDLTPIPFLKTKGDTNITFDGQLSRPLKYHEDAKSGCGGQTWPAGMIMGKQLLRYHREELKTARILELGTGGGLVGCSIALECGVQHPLLLTDQEEMMDLLNVNIRLNEMEDLAKPLILNWGEPLPTEVIAQKPTVIIAAECVYFEPAFPLLMQTLKDLLDLNDEAVVYFCFKKRRRAEMKFVKTAKKTFLVEELFDEDRPIFERRGLFLFSFRSRKAALTNGRTRL